MQARAAALVLAVALGVVAPAAARTYHVAPGGSDGNPGTRERPFRTIQQGVDAARAGDTVLVHAGTYRAETFPMVDLEHGGRRGAPLTLAAAPGAAPVLVGTPEHRYGIRLASGVSDVVVAGLVLREFAADAVQLDCRRCADASEHRRVVLRFLEVSGSGTAVRLMSGRSLAVRDSWLHDNEGVGVDCAPGPCNDLLLHRTRLERNAGFSWSDGLAVERGRGIRVVECVARGNAGDGFDSKASDTRVLRSQALGNARDGIKLWRGTSAILASVAAGNGLPGVVIVGGGRFTVASSLVADNGRVVRSYGMEVYGEGGAATLTVFDTIFAGNNGTALYAGPSVAVVREDHDLFSTGGRGNSAIQVGETFVEEADLNGGAWTAATGLGRGTFAARPLFAGPADYRLLAGSPGVDDGTAQGAPALALDRTRRPLGAGFDIGPYER